MGGGKKRYFPMFVDLTEKKVVVVGAGTIAKRRIRAMVDFTEHLVVIAPEVNQELRELEEQGRLTICRKAYEREDLYGAAMVIAASADNRINQDIYACCKCLGIPVNVYNDREKCDFYFPGLAVSGQMVVGVSSIGREKRKQKGLAERIGRFLEQEEACSGKKETEQESGSPEA